MKVNIARDKNETMFKSAFVTKVLTLGEHRMETYNLVSNTEEEFKKTVMELLIIYNFEESTQNFSRINEHSDFFVKMTNTFTF